VAGRSIDRATPVLSSSDTDDDGGGGALPLVLFGVVGLGLLSATGFVWYRRRRAGG
jgi:LPXTG-motif cell wall-anchored protein